MLNGLGDLRRIGVLDSRGLNHASHDLFLTEPLQQHADMEDEIDTLTQVWAQRDQCALGIVELAGLGRFHRIAKCLSDHRVIPWLGLGPWPETSRRDWGRDGGGDGRGHIQIEVIHRYRSPIDGCWRGNRRNRDWQWSWNDWGCGCWC